MKGRILVIEDDDTLRDLMKDLFEHNEFHVDTAANGIDGLRRLMNDRYDLIITDIIMPEKEGLETIMEIHSKYPEMKIIAISGGGSMMPKDYLNIARILGAVKTLEKPFLMETLLDAVYEIIPA
jgi:DNA-binding NtrC family response regulator